MKIVGLGGGIGASRFWSALVPHVGAEHLTIVVNVADDLWMHGLRVCPDIDTTLYALSGRRDAERGWGVAGESWRCMDALRDLGDDVWFNLGDLDLATHLRRTSLLRDGHGLADVTARLAGAMGVGVTVLPATEDDVTTYVDTIDGERLHYEEFLVRRGAEPILRRVEHAGIERATAAPGVLGAIAAADRIVIAPSHPVASVLPILEIAGLHAAIAASPAPVVAVSPIVTGVAIADPGEARRALSRERMMATIGQPATATGTASLYQSRHPGLIDRFVIDAADEDEQASIAALGLDAVVAPTLVHLGAPAGPLVATVLEPAHTTTR